MTDSQRARIDEFASSEDLTMAEVIRRALDVDFAGEFPDPADAF